MVVTHGVDTEAFGAFVEHAAENPEEVAFELSARAIYEGRAFHSLAKVDEYSFGGEEIRRETREYTFPMGTWKEVEDVSGFVDPTDRPEPIEVSLAALTSCLNVAVGVTAIHEGIDLEDLETRVRLDFDPRVILLIHDPDRSGESFENIEIEIDVAGEGIGEEERALLEAGARRSPVWNLMHLAHDMDPSVSVTDRTAAAADD